MTEIDPDSICFTIDVEWACAPVLEDLRRLFDERGIVATFFVTHAGVDVGGHRRGLHPNFRRNGDTWKSIVAAHGGSADRLDEAAIHRGVVSATHAFAPEAKGVRAHSLYSESTLLPVYREFGIEFDCTYLMPLVRHLRPFWREHLMVAIPTYWADHFDVMTGATGFEVDRLDLSGPGIKVLDLHPNIVFLNARSNAEYMATKTFYGDPDRLLAARNAGRGIRTLLSDIFDRIDAKKLPVATVDQVSESWRSGREWK